MTNFVDRVNHMPMTRPNSTILAAILALSVIFMHPVSVSAQSRSVTFDATAWNFGTIEEDKGAVSHVFTFVNNSDSPVTVRKAIPSCNCIVASFASVPVEPRKTGEVLVTFSPSGSVGATHRTVELVDEKGISLGTLSTDADVIPSDRDIQDRYPIVLGTYLYASRSKIPFGYIKEGESMTQIVYLANSSSKTLKIELYAGGPPFLSIEHENYIGPGKEIPVILTYSAPEGDGIFATWNNVITVTVDGHAVSGQLTTSAIQLERAEKSADAPAMQTYPSEGKLKKGFFGSRYSGSIEIRNNGVSDLIIHAVEVPMNSKFSISNGTALKKGGKIDATLSIDNPTDGDYVVLIFTNDPVRPYRELYYHK